MKEFENCKELQNSSVNSCEKFSKAILSADTVGTSVLDLSDFCVETSKSIVNNK